MFCEKQPKQIEQVVTRVNVKSTEKESIVNQRIVRQIFDKINKGQLNEWQAKTSIAPIEEQFAMGFGTGKSEDDDARDTRRFEEAKKVVSRLTDMQTFISFQGREAGLRQMGRGFTAASLWPRLSF